MTVAAAPAVRPRSLLPQEHGAWGQLAMPLLSALLIAGAAPAALLLTAATVLGFLAHEPWLVVLGHRGVRAVRDDGRRARRVMRLLLLGAAVTGGVGLWLAPSVARWALLLPAALAAGVIALVLAGRERTVPGELTVVMALASSGLAIALAAGAPPRVAAAATVTWVLAFATSVFAVQVVLARAHSRGETELGRPHALAVALVGAGGPALAALAGLGWIVAAAVAPTALLSLVVCLAPFSARQLRTLGWGLVASSTATLLVLVVGLRAGS
jgi:YwiC-like protein